MVRASQVAGSLCQVLHLLLQAPGTPPCPPLLQHPRWLCKQSTLQPLLLNNQTSSDESTEERVDGGRKGVHHLSSSLPSNKVSLGARTGNTLKVNSGQ